MTIWVCGNSALSRTVHSMPDMRGRKISMSTTSGCSCGMVRTASSPVAQAQLQTKSGKELMSFVQLSRTLGWSSTKATLSGRLGFGSVERLLLSGLVVLALGGVMALRGFVGAGG